MERQRFRESEGLGTEQEGSYNLGADLQDIDPRRFEMRELLWGVVQELGGDNVQFVSEGLGERVVELETSNGTNYLGGKVWVFASEIEPSPMWHH